METQPPATGRNIIDFLYQLVLGRAPDEMGLAFWEERINAGTPIMDIFHALLDSIEFRAIARDHPWLRGQPPRPASLDWWKSTPGVFPLRIVDAGARSLPDEEHAYSALLSSYPCHVTGFEPLPAELERRQAAEPEVDLLPYFLGDGTTGTFYVTEADACSSLFEPNLSLMRAYAGDTGDGLRIVSAHTASTARLDEIWTQDRIDFLKLDVQGSELSVLRGAKATLSRTLVIHTEIAFDEVYLHQPLFADVDTYLRDADFEFIDFISSKRYRYATQHDCGPTSSRLLWGDALYIKRVDALAQTGRDLLATACIMHTNYDKRDLCGSLLERYDDAEGSNLAAQYTASVAPRL